MTALVPASVPPLIAPRSRWAAMLSSRFLPPILITLLLIPAQLIFGILISFQGTALAILVSMGGEIVLGRMVLGHWPNLASSYMSGISVGILLRSPFLWPYALASLLSTSSKYAVRFKGRHLFNPSNFGVSALVLLAPNATSILGNQWGNHLGPMILIWVIGIAIAWRARRLDVSLAYVAAFVVFASARSVMDGTPWLAAVAPITGPMYQLYICLMITDPRTTLSTPRGRVVVVVVVALVEMLMRQFDVVNAPFYALFVVGVPALALELWWKDRKRTRPAG
ncbi:MAG: hypothetical protein IT182_17915 [Acidobacteria bacterium]|nr:hypothetical protein [Acidobacteriota bacterium]